MSRGPDPASLTLTDDERAKLAAGVRRPTSAQRLALRSRIARAAAEGRSNAAIAADLGVTRPTVRKWRDRFAGRRLEGLADEPRPGPPRTITDGQVEAAVTRALEAEPRDATHWSTRSLARDLGLSQSAVVRIGHAFGLKPHRHETSKRSADPFFVEKVRDLVGLYLAPPDRAAVLCVGEASQIQALDRTQPAQPPLPGRAERARRDDTRHGTTPRFAALDVATGRVIGSCHRRHRHQAFLAFLDHIDAAVPRAPGTTTHVVMDNYGTHEHPRVRDGFVRHPAFVPHFTPTGSSWRNQAERSFAQITERRIRRGAFRSAAELEAAIESYVRAHNRQPRPFVRTESAELILPQVRKRAERLAPPTIPETNS